MHDRSYAVRLLPLRAALAALLMLFSFAAAGPAVAQGSGAASLPLWEVIPTPGEE
jgi:hypothetical protein